MVFPVKWRQIEEIKGGDKRKLFILFVPLLTLSLFSKIVCSLWFDDETEAELIREKLEQFMTNILAEVEKRDKRFQSTVIKSGSVYDGTKVCRPDEFDFMIRIDSLADKPLIRPCDKGESYVKLLLDEQEWEEFKDDEGFFNPHMISRFFKKLVNASLSDAALPEGLGHQTSWASCV